MVTDYNEVLASNKKAYEDGYITIVGRGKEALKTKDIDDVSKIVFVGFDGNDTMTITDEGADPNQVRNVRIEFDG